MEMSAPSQLLRSLGPLPETFAQTPQAPEKSLQELSKFPVGRLVGRLSYTHLPFVS